MPHPDDTTRLRVAYTVTFQPGDVASIQAELEAELDDREVAAGVREAADIPHYLRALLRAG